MLGVIKVASLLTILCFSGIASAKEKLLVGKPSSNGSVKVLKNNANNKGKYDSVEFHLSILVGMKNQDGCTLKKTSSNNKLATKEAKWAYTKDSYNRQIYSCEVVLGYYGLCSVVQSKTQGVSEQLGLNSGEWQVKLTYDARYSKGHRNEYKIGVIRIHCLK